MVVRGGEEEFKEVLRCGLGALIEDGAGVNRKKAARF